MDRPGSPPNDPSLLLLNEIEILLAQTRLMELYLKQAQVSAAHKAIGVREQHQANLPSFAARWRKRTSCRNSAKCSQRQ